MYTKRLSFPTQHMNNIPHIVDTGFSLRPSTITFSSTNSDWVMQITSDRKIIVNEGVEVSEAAKAVLNALQNMLLPIQKELTDEEITQCLNESMDIKDVWGQPMSELNPFNFARAILKKASEK